MRGSRGVGAFTTVAARVPTVSTVRTGVQPAGQKKKLGPTTLPVVRNGALSQRAERSKSSLKRIAGYGINGLARGVAGKGSQAQYTQAVQQAKQQVIDAVTASQPGLDKIDSTLLGVDSQLAALRDAAGPTAPADVLSVVEDAAADRRTLGDAVDSIKGTIDQMNAAAAAVPAGAGIGNFGVGTPGQVALDKARQQAQTLASQITTIQRTLSSVYAKTEAATQQVNRYVDTVNAQAAQLVAQQQQQAQATDIAYQLTDQQKAQAAAQAQLQQQGLLQQQTLQQQGLLTQQGQQQTLAQQQADQSSSYANQQAQFQAQLQAQIQAQQQAFNQAQAQQQQYAPPSYPQVQYQPQVQQYPGAAQVAPVYPQPSPVQYQPDQQQYYPAPSQQYDPMQYYQTPQDGWGGGEGPGEANGWGAQVFGVSGFRQGGGSRGSRGIGDVGFTSVNQPMAVPQGLSPVATPGAAPSSSALAAAQARQILAQANAQIADARKQIEAQRIASEQAALRAAQPPETQTGTGMSTLTKVLIVAGVGFGAVKVGGAIAGRRK